MKHQHATRFIRYFFGSAGLLLLLTGIFNLVVDPFSMFQLVTVEGFNEQKPEFSKHVRMVKAYAVRFQRPAGLILGSSRAEYGLDPEHPGWNAASRPVYNLALPSGSIYEALRYLQHAQAIHAIKQVVLAVDLFMFNADWQKVEDFREDRLATPASFDPNIGWLKDVATALFSIDALRASQKTIVSQGDSHYVAYLHNGARDPLTNWNNIRFKGGHHAAFISNERYSLTAPDGWALFSLGDTQVATQSPYESFRNLLVFCREHDITLYVLISPIHARKLEIMWQLGLWDTFENWKRALLNIIVADAALHPEARPYPLWDFSGYNIITTESLPGLGDDTTQMQWYWEGSHYKKEVGDLMLDRVLKNQVNENSSLKSFGKRITREGIESHLQDIRSGHDAYRNSAAADIEEIKILIMNTAAERDRLVKGEISAVLHGDVKPGVDSPR